MSRFSIQVDIAGSLVALVSDASITTGLYAPGTIEVIRSVGQSLTQSLNLENFQTDLGGTTIYCTDINTLINDQYSNSSLIASVTATMSKTALSVTVDSTAGFPAAGYIWIGGEAIEYTAKTPTAFTWPAVLNRGALFTNADSHNINSVVYGYNPTIIGRKCQVSWTDRVPGHSFHTMYIGYIEGYEFTDSGANLNVVSAQNRITEKTIAGVEFGTASLARDIKGPISGLGSTSNSPVQDDIVLSISNKDNTLTEYGLPTTNNGDVYIKIDDEIISYNTALYPMYDVTITNVLGPASFEITITNSAEAYILSLVRPGDRVDVVDFVTGDIRQEGASIFLINAPLGSFTIGAIVNITLTGSNPGVVAGDFIKANYNTIIPSGFYKRGLFETKAAPHRAGADVNEIRVLEGDSVDQLYEILFSKDGDRTSGPSGGIYDVLPPGWGLGLEESDVNLASFSDAGLVSFPRRFLLTDGMDATEYLAWSGFFMGAIFTWDSLGVLHAIPYGDIYPGEIPAHIINDSKLYSGTVPTISLDRGTILNKASVKTDIDEEGKHKTSLTVIDAESISLYGTRTLPELPNVGMLWSDSPTTAYISLFNLLSLRSRASGVVQCEVIFYDLPEAGTPVNKYQVGDNVSFEVPFLPNIKGGSGIDGIFRVIEVSPNETNGTIGLTLQSFPNTSDLGRVGPSLIVESFVAPTITVYPRLVTHLSPDPGTQKLTVSPPGFPGPGLGGYEDIEWFLNDDEILHYPEIYPSAGTVYQITNIDYANRRFDLVGAVVTPPVAGDTISLGDWATVSASPTAALRRFFFIWGSVLSTLTGGDKPYRWGT